MTGRTQATDEAVALAATALPDAYGSWASAEIPCKGHEWVTTQMTTVYSSATSIEVKMQQRASGGTWRDVRKAPEGVGALDELTEATGGAALNITHQWFVGPFNFVRFLAKRTGGSASDTLAMDWSGV